MELNKIYNEDCIKGMQKLDDNSVDLIITDPPYILEHHGGGKSALAKRGNGVRDRLDFISNDFDYEACFNEMLRVCKIPNFFIFCSTQQVSRTMKFFEDKKLMVNLLIWNKTNPSPLCNKKYINDVEFIVYVRGKNAPFNNDTPFEFKRRVYTSKICPDGNKLHPTQKPLELITRYVLQHSNEGSVVLDPFMGSGTTAIACLKNNRHFIGFEINKDYYETSLKRIEENEN